MDRLTARWTSGAVGVGRAVTTMEVAGTGTAAGGMAEVGTEAAEVGMAEVGTEEAAAGMAVAPTEAAGVVRGAAAAMGGMGIDANRTTYRMTRPSCIARRFAKTQTKTAL